MNKTQKSAWYGVLLAALMSSVFLIDAYEKTLGLIVTHLIGYLILLPLLIVPLYFLNRKKNKAEEFDERDKLICKKGLILAFTVVAIALITEYVIIYLAFGETHSISISQLPIILYTSFMILILVLSIAVLVQYGWGGKKDGREEGERL